MFPIHHCDFSSFDDAVREARDYFERRRDPGPLREFFGGDIHPGLFEAHIDITADEFLRLARVEDGITLVKSPKGTGKTECLRGVIAGDRSVLLIGHRVALIHQSCARLDLQCYLDHEDRHLKARRLGVCLDSLQRLQGDDGVLTAFDTVVIDESEQVLMHFLSDTMSAEGRAPAAVFTVFKTLLRRARRVIALDADLGWTTFETLTRLVKNEPSPYTAVKKKPRRRHVRIVINDRPSRGLVEVFRFDRQLHADLKHELAAGKRAFVASNSRKLLARLDAAIANELPGVRSIRVTSDTVALPEVRAFIAAPAQRALDYDLIMASPSMGTGIDITFPDRAREIDVAYGFFDALIATHFEIDQQLARVRHPGAIRVWVSPRRFQRDTARDVVRGHLLRSHLFGHLLVDFDVDGRPVHRVDDLFLAMATLVVSQANASKNHLRRNFLRHKARQGYEVAVATEDDDLHAEGIALTRLGRGLATARRARAVLGAPPLHRAEFEDVKERLETRDEVLEAEAWSFVRTALELFYRELATSALVTLDDEGRYRQSVKRFVSAGFAHQDIRADLVRIGDKPLDPRARFIKKPRDVAAAVVRMLHHTPLMSDGALVLDVTLTKGDLAEFVDALLRERAIVENVLGLDVRADLREKPITSLNAILKVIGLRVRNTRRRRVNGAIVREYELDRGATIR